MTSLCATMCRPDLLGQAPPYPFLALSCHAPPWPWISLSFALPCLFPIMLLVCSRSPSTLVTVLHITILIRFCSSPALACPCSSGPALTIPFQSRANLPWNYPDLALALPFHGPPWSCLGTSVTLTLRLPCSSPTLNVSLSRDLCHAMP